VRKLTLLGAILVVLAVPGRAVGDGEDWKAALAGQSGNLTLESGETATSFFKATNIGTQVWDPSVVRLGAENPRDRSSTMFNPADWDSAQRAALLDEASIAPGQTGTFTFVVRAPEITAATVSDEYFAPVADGFAWMDNPGGAWPMNAVFIRYTIVPRQPPTASIISSPDRVGQGQPIDVSADASDNVHIARVAFGIDGHDTVSDNSRPYSATLGLRRAERRASHDRGARLRRRGPAGARDDVGRRARFLRRRRQRQSDGPQRASSAASARRRAPGSRSAMARARCCAGAS
jgi:hypothetical protein